MPKHTPPENSVCNAGIYASIRRRAPALPAGAEILRFAHIKKYKKYTDTGRLIGGARKRGSNENYKFEIPTGG